MKSARLLVAMSWLLGASALGDDAVPVEAPFEIKETKKISVAVKHAWARTEAAARLGYLLAYWKKRFGVTEDWRGDQVFVTGQALGMKIRARFTITDHEVIGEAIDPGWPWAGQAQTYAERKLKKYMHPNYDEP